ncbi:glycerophosphodiester phosphodiesterase [Naasia lichenicola]|uniref:glycerophosphodiester phosphodiesterase n=1 Tax=Naasia lichenicola TaxID=2565933 RepID=UPI00130E3708|nr:glycerophosphodiester phosphodiesterase family protein [Naasia lichenicola]
MTAIRLIAHRGASAAFPEHTRAAYLQAIADGADGLEGDVHLTADRQLVLWHDATLDRTTDESGLLHERTIDELRAIDLMRGQAIPEDFGAPEQQLLTLPELIDIALASGRPLMLAIELKRPDPFGRELERAVLDTLDAHHWDRRTGALGLLTVSLMSFDPGSVALLRTEVDPSLVMLLTGAVDPDEVAAIVASDPTLNESEAALERERLTIALTAAIDLIDDGQVQGGPDIEWVREEPDRVRGWIERGLTVRVWTVDTLQDLEFCLELGISEVTTNRPGELRIALETGTIA